MKSSTIWDSKFIQASLETLPPAMGTYIYGAPHTHTLQSSHTPLPGAPPRGPALSNTLSPLSEKQKGAGVAFRRASFEPRQQRYCIVCCTVKFLPRLLYRTVACGPRLIVLWGGVACVAAVSTFEYLMSGNEAVETKHSVSRLTRRQPSVYSIGSPLRHESFISCGAR